MSAPPAPGATNGSAEALPYGGDVQAAAKAKDREAIRTIMAWRTAKERARGATRRGARAGAPGGGARGSAPSGGTPAPGEGARARRGPRGGGRGGADAPVAVGPRRPSRTSAHLLHRRRRRRGHRRAFSGRAPAPSILGNNAADGGLRPSRRRRRR